jgi:hypothetical protein
VEVKVVHGVLFTRLQHELVLLQLHHPVVVGDLLRVLRLAVAGEVLHLGFDRGAELVEGRNGANRARWSDLRVCADARGYASTSTEGVEE